MVGAKGCKVTEPYKIAVVMGRAGMNDAQHAFMKHHLTDVARTLAAPVRLVVPAIPDRGCRDNIARALLRAEQMIEPLRQALPRLDLEFVGAIPMGEIIPILAACDEVHCATCPGAGSEFYTRPANVMRAAAQHPRYRVFRWLHYWVELDPKHLPAQDVGRPKKKTPPLKG
jgi:hypothetical protein